MDGPDPVQRFPFAFDGPSWVTRVAQLIGVRPETAWVDVDAERVVVRFGRWSLATPRSNVAEVRVTGPYRAWKIAGTPRLSLVDKGITFGTTPSGGVCVRFHEPVVGPLGRRVPHPAMTVTVADPGAFVSALVG